MGVIDEHARMHLTRMLVNNWLAVVLTLNSATISEVIGIEIRISTVLIVFYIHVP